MNADRVIRRQKARLHERAQQPDRAGQVAARVGHARGARNTLSLPFAHLRKAVDPARRGAMRRAGVDHAHARVDDGRDRLARGRIGQAQDGDIAGVDGLGTALRVFAGVGGKRQQFQVLPLDPAAQTLVDLQAGGALVAVDEDEGRGHGGRSQGKKMVMNASLHLRARPRI